MKRKLVLFCVLLCSMICFFACNKDPYKDMSLVKSNDDTYVQLNIEEQAYNGNKVYNFDTYSFDVQIKNVDNNVNKQVVISGGEGILNTSVVYMGNGISKISVTPISKDKTGKCTLVIKSKEGNKSLSIDFQIDLKLNNFTINQNNLQVVAKGQEIDLSNLDKYIDFSPFDTTQKDIKFEVVVPNNGEIENYPGNYYEYDNFNGQTYAYIENNVLKTNTGVTYPNKLQTVVVGGEETQVLMQCITLKASFENDSNFNKDENGNIISKRIPDRFIDIEVIEDCSNINLRMNCQKNDSAIEDGDANSFTLEKNDKGEYDVTLIDPNYRYGVQYDSYYIERDLMFDFGEVEGNYNPNDYYIYTDTVLETENLPIVLSYSALDNSFKVQAQKAGTYQHIFKVEHVKYPNVITAEIKVNFIVLDIPTNIKVNGNSIQDEYKVYDYYSNSYGARFNINLNNNTGGFDYFVYVKNDQLANNLKIYKSDGTEQVIAKCIENGGIKEIVSSKDGVPYSNFKNNETFYLSHSFETLPQEETQIFIGISYSVASPSYSNETKENYFITEILEFPINVIFEFGLRDITFTQSKYMLDLTNTTYCNNELDINGIKLFDLPIGQSFEDCIESNGISYDQTLINVYHIYDEVEDITSVYMKCNNELKVGTTNILVKTKNGISKSVYVETFIPTVYANNLALPDESDPYFMPLGVGFNEDDALYYFTGKNDDDPKELYSLYKTTELGQEYWGDYLSIKTLFMLNQTSMNLRFYDYLLTYDLLGNKTFTPIDVTSKVKVSFNYDGYASYKDGLISVYKVTEDINNPIIMTVTYNGGYIGINDQGVSEYKTLNVTLRINLYIYLPLQGVQVTTSKNVDLYLDESLGMYNKDLAVHTIISDFIPNEVKLGADWNNNWFNEDLPVNLTYDFDKILENPIYLADGSEFIIRSLNGVEEYKLHYKDLFAKGQVENGNEYTCTVHCKISEELEKWIREKSGYSADDYELYIQTNIFSKNISLVVNVYITQFSKLQNINSVKFNAKFASKITEFSLDIPDDGVYFEIRNDEQSTLKQSIVYYVNSADVVNKNIRLFNSSNSVFYATVNPDAIGNSGTINITTLGSGVQYLTAVPEDNIKSYNSETGIYEFYNNDLVQEFRVKVADGSIELPYEIRTIKDYEQMQEDIRNNDYNYYILTRNINLAEVTNGRASFINLSSSQKDEFDTFSLNGQYTYFRNGVEYTSINSLYNLYIKQTINSESDLNLGLFGSLNSKVIIRNLNVLNSIIDLQIENLNGTDLNIGIFAGTSQEAKIYNSQATGSIRVINKSSENLSSAINIGGMIGYSLNTTINGLPISYQSGISNSAYNSNVNIDFAQYLNDNPNAINSFEFNVGGVIGFDKKSSELTNLSILPTIKGINYNSSVGGVVGKSQNGVLNKIVVYPKISITDSKFELPNNVLNVSSIIGSGNEESSSGELSIKDSKVYFVRENFSGWLNNSGIYINSSSIINFGGIIGSLKQNNAEILYTYIRSFYTNNFDDNYKGNIYVVNNNLNSNIAGIVGTVDNNTIDIKSSYFDADITLSQDINVGLIIANASAKTVSNISNSYAIGRLNYIDNNDLIPLSEINGSAGLIGNLTFTDATDSLFTGISLQKAQIENITIDNVYGVINDNIYYFGENNGIYGLYDGKTIDNIIPLINADNFNILFEGLGYNILIDGVDARVVDEIWLWNREANKIGDLAYPMLFNATKTKVLYDLIPEYIVLDRINSVDYPIYDISFNDKTQILMFVNKNQSVTKNDYYEISVDEENSAISIKFNGQTIVTNYLEMVTDLVITEDSNGTIISLVGSKIYPINEGQANITIYCSLDKTIRLDILIKVVAGITEINLCENDNDTNQYNEITNYEKGQLTSTVYIDETNNYLIKNVNIIDDVEYFSTNSIGYKLEVINNIGSDENLVSSTGTININGKDYYYDNTNNSNNINFLNSNSLNIRGVKIGNVVLKITPYIILDDIEYFADQKYLLLNDLSKTYVIKSNARARDIQIDKDSLKIAPKNTTNFNVIVESSNVEINNYEDLNKINILSKLKISVNSKTFIIDCDKQYEANLVNNQYFVPFDYEIDYELIRLKFNGITILNTDINSPSSQNTYKLIFKIEVQFNSDYYRTNSNDFDLNLIEYNYKFIPLSNETVQDNITISISPSELTTIFTNFYSKGELIEGVEGESYPEENESNFIVPGRSGLLKITLDEEFNDSSFITVTLSREYEDFVNIHQMSGIIDQYINSTNSGSGSDIQTLTDNITSYKNLVYEQKVENANEYGIRLSKLTLNYMDQNYFNKTYFVKLDLNRNYGSLENVNLIITSYKVSGSQVNVQLVKELTLQVTQLPLIDVKVDNEYSANLGVGIQKPLEITYRGLNDDIRFSINDKDGNVIDSSNENYDKVYITDENGNKVISALSIDYLNAGKKYYINADVLSSITTLKISFVVDEIVLGVRESAKSDLTVNLVEFEIDEVKINRADEDNIIRIKHGEGLILTTNISYKNITVGTQDDIAEYKETLSNYITSVEYASTGTIVRDNGSSIPLIDGILRLSYIKYIGGDKIEEPMSINGTYNYISLEKGLLNDLNYNYEYFVIKGTGVTFEDNMVTLRLKIPYYYDNGKLIVSDQMLGYYSIDLEFYIVVEDNSTYDHPNPIETQDDLIKACNSNGGDYILLNNLTLENWIPMNANFNSLDGNGYVISVKSFNLNSIRNSDNANVGIFATTGANTLLKNIIVDVADLLNTENTLLQQISNLANSSINNYRYEANIDMSYTQNVNFGILVGTNNGAITNAKIINTRDTYGASNNNSSNIGLYYHVVTSQGYVDNEFVISNIGGIAGINSETGSITNSFVGLNNSTIDKSGNSYIQYVTNPSKDIYNNADDSLSAGVQIYPFVLAGGNNLGGLVAENNGIISNSYAKGLGLYNSYPAVNDSKTAGLVATNNGTITSCFAEGNAISNYRAVENKFIIESTGNIGGFVFENNNLIENSYSNVYLETQSAFTGGFVYLNNENGNIHNSYSTAVNRNSLAHGQFTGVDINGRDVLNYGTYKNAYYLVLNKEITNQNEHATAIINEESPIDSQVTWKGFSFAKGSSSDDGIWKLSTSNNSIPVISSSTIDTISFRKLVDIITDSELEDGGTSTGTTYVYEYNAYNLGSVNNPLIIDKAKNFDKYIIDNSQLINDQMVFGINTTNVDDNVLANANAIRHVRLVNNLDFKNITTATMYKNTYLYNTVFAGVLDGNGMTLSNLNINTDTLQLDNFGLFAQIGVESTMSTSQAVIKNLNLTLRTYKSSDSSRAGILAGTIINSDIINVKINGNSDNQSNAVIGARNMAGALAGLIYADDGGIISLKDIVVENVVIESTYGSLNGEITADSYDRSGGFYNKFLIKNIETQTDIDASFVSLYNKTSKQTELSDENNIRKDVSYSGSVAGVLVANNYDSNISYDNLVEDYRTNPDSNTIDNILVRNNIVIRTSDNAGGLFGYIGENTLVKNSKFELSDNQLIKAFNFAGGIVGENHGVIEQCSVEFSDNIQQDIDNRILLNDRENDNYTLFDTQTSGDFTVSIGGIAGYSNNGIIIDSYSKANVTKIQSYISGGILGYSENYNLIGYSYSTGAVYSKFITGGIVGLQVNKGLENSGSPITNDDGNYYLVMDHVHALTDWNAYSDQFDFRQNITSKLYENQKVLYENNGSYYNFYVKMPEVGNLNIVENNDTYYLNHNSYYVGSAIGYAIINIGSSDNSYSSNLDGDNKLISNGKLNNFKFFANANVYTNTLGLYSTSGSLATGNKQDTYFDLTFDYNIGTNNAISLYSYRIAYKSNNNMNINYYDNLEVDSNNTNNYYDIVNYPQIFVQEYTQQILGAYSVLSTTNDTTKNLFKFNYDELNRYKISDSSNAFVNIQNENIWKIGRVLPEFSHGLYESQITIDTTDKLESCLTSISTGKIYSIATGEYTINIDSDTKSINYSNTIRDTYVGVEDESNKRPKIIFNIGNDTNKSTVNTIFNSLSGVNFENIEFEFNFVNCNYTSNKDYNEFGLIANSLQNVYFKNCKINVILNQNLNLERNTTNGQVTTFESENVGLMFGNIFNSVFENNEFCITIPNITINEENISNFGLFAGNISNSLFADNVFNFDVTQIELQGINSNFNFGGIAGVFNYSSISSSNNANVFAGTETINVIENLIQIGEINQINVSSMFGYSNNSNISDVVVNNAMNIEIGSEKIYNLNVSNIVALSSGIKINNTIVVDSSSITLQNLSTKQHNNINIGSFIGEDLSNSIVRENSYSLANIEINTKATNLSVGGLIGKSNNSSNLVDTANFSGQIYVTNSGVGKYEDDKVTLYATTYVGGILGQSSSVLGIAKAYSSGVIEVDTSVANDNTCKFGIGGIVGRISGNANISEFSVLNQFDITVAETNIAEIYLSGVVGLNNGLFLGNNGFTLVKLPQNSNILTSAITNNSISKNCTDIYYSQEFVSNNYSSDSYFNYYALADLYNTINEYAEIYKLIRSGSHEAVSKGNISIPIPKDLSSENIQELDIYTLQELSGTITNVTSKYNVINEENVKLNISSLNAGYIISGRTTESGKIVVDVENNVGSTDTSFAVDTNNGILSNIYLRTTSLNNLNNGLNVALVNENNGLITNIYVYGYTTNTYSFANQNNGKIYQSASANIYIGNENTIYGLVNTNNTYGVISDCYSSNFGYLKNQDKKTSVYGLAQTNNGNISYSFYYVPDVMLYDNTVSGSVSNIGETGKIYNVYNNKLPTFINTRTKIWTTENDHAQLIGFKDIQGAIVIKVKINGIDSHEDAYSLETIKDKLKGAGNYYFDYDINFYVTEQDQIPTYNIIRFNDGVSFVNYINNLNSNYIPENTVILLENNIEDSEVQEIRINNTLKEFSIPASSMILGTTRNNTVTKSAVIKYNSSSQITHEFITYNYGVIANITFDGLRFNNQSSISKFAPILNNYGTISGVNYKNTTIFGGSARYVSGLVSNNLKTGIINNCNIENLSISSVEYVNYICTESYGKIYNTNTSGSTTAVGTIYPYGKNGGNDNDIYE